MPRPSLPCSCVHLTKFTGASVPTIFVASVSDMLAISPNDLFSKLRLLTALVAGLFGAMHVLMGAALVWDARDRRGGRAALFRDPAMGFRVEDSGAWSWSFRQDPVERRRGGDLAAVSGGIVRLCQLAGIPFVRLRLALPEDLLDGSAALAIGRAGGIAPERMKRALEEERELRGRQRERRSEAGRRGAGLSWSRGGPGVGAAGTQGGALFAAASAVRWAAAGARRLAPRRRGGRVQPQPQAEPGTQEQTAPAAAERRPSLRRKALWREAVRFDLPPPPAALLGSRVDSDAAPAFDGRAGPVCEGFGSGALLSGGEARMSSGVALAASRRLPNPQQQRDRRASWAAGRGGGDGGGGGAGSAASASWVAIAAPPASPPPQPASVWAPTAVSRQPPSSCARVAPEPQPPQEAPAQARAARQAAPEQARPSWQWPAARQRRAAVHPAEENGGPRQAVWQVITDDERDPAAAAYQSAVALIQRAKDGLQAPRHAAPRWPQVGDGRRRGRVAPLPEPNPVNEDPFPPPPPPPPVESPQARRRAWEDDGGADDAAGAQRPPSVHSIVRSRIEAWRALSASVFAREAEEEEKEAGPGSPGAATPPTSIPATPPSAPSADAVPAPTPPEGAARLASPLSRYRVGSGGRPDSGLVGLGAIAEHEDDFRSLAGLSAGGGDTRPQSVASLGVHASAVSLAIGDDKGQRESTSAAGREAPRELPPPPPVRALRVAGESDPDPPSSAASASAPDEAARPRSQQWSGAWGRPPRSRQGPRRSLADSLASLSFVGQSPLAPGAVPSAAALSEPGVGPEVASSSTQSSIPAGGATSAVQQQAPEQPHRPATSPAGAARFPLRQSAPALAALEAGAGVSASVGGGSAQAPRAAHSAGPDGGLSPRPWHAPPPAAAPPAGPPSPTPSAHSSWGALGAPHPRPSTAASVPDRPPPSPVLPPGRSTGFFALSEEERPPSSMGGVRLRFVFGAEEPAPAEPPQPSPGPAPGGAPNVETEPSLPPAGGDEAASFAVAAAAATAGAAATAAATAAAARVGAAAAASPPPAARAQTPGQLRPSTAGQLRPSTASALSPILLAEFWHRTDNPIVESDGEGEEGEGGASAAVAAEQPPAAADPPAAEVAEPLPAVVAAEEAPPAPAAPPPAAPEPLAAVAAATEEEPPAPVAPPALAPPEPSAAVADPSAAAAAAAAPSLTLAEAPEPERHESSTGAPDDSALPPGQGGAETDGGGTTDGLDVTVAAAVRKPSAFAPHHVARAAEGPSSPRRRRVSAIGILGWERVLSRLRVGRRDGAGSDAGQQSPHPLSPLRSAVEKIVERASAKVSAARAIVQRRSLGGDIPTGPTPTGPAKGEQPQSPEAQHSARAPGSARARRARAVLSVTTRKRIRDWADGAAPGSPRASAAASPRSSYPTSPASAVRRASSTDAGLSEPFSPASPWGDNGGASFDQIGSPRSGRESFASVALGRASTASHWSALSRRRDRLRLARRLSQLAVAAADGDASAALSPRASIDSLLRGRRVASSFHSAFLCDCFLRFVRPSSPARVPVRRSSAGPAPPASAASSPAPRRRTTTTARRSSTTPATTTRSSTTRPRTA